MLSEATLAIVMEAGSIESLLSDLETLVTNSTRTLKYLKRQRGMKIPG
jgi:amino acid transporter